MWVWLTISTIIILIAFIIGAIAISHNFDSWVSISSFCFAIVMILFAVGLCMVGMNKETKVVQAKLDEKAVHMKEEQDKKYMLISKELQTTKDKIILENVENYYKVTTEKGIYKVYFSYMKNGDVLGIEKLEKIL